MILNAITSRKALINDRIVFYIIVEFARNDGTHSRVTMNIEKGATWRQLVKKLKDFVQRIIIEDAQIENSFKQLEED